MILSGSASAFISSYFYNTLGRFSFSGVSNYCTTARVIINPATLCFRFRIDDIIQDRNSAKYIVKSLYAENNERFYYALDSHGIIRLLSEDEICKNGCLDPACSQVDLCTNIISRAELALQRIAEERARLPCV